MASTGQASPRRGRGASLGAVRGARRGLFAPALAASLLLASGGDALARPGDEGSGEEGVQEGNLARAATLHDEARALYERGEYRLAIRKLEAAVRLDPEGKELYYNLAVLHEKLLEYEIAVRYLSRYVEMEDDAALRGRARATLRRVEGARRELAARERARKRRRAPETDAPAPGPAAAPAPRPAPTLTLALVGAGAAALALGGAFATSAALRDPGSSPRTGPGTSVEDLRKDARTAHAHAVVADVSFAVALTSAVGAVLAHLFLDRKAPAAGAVVLELPGRRSAAAGRAARD